FIIIDTLGKAIHPRDFNDYAKINEHITPLINLSRASDCHIMMLHHAAKGTGEGDDFDKVLGSQAIRGAVDTVLLLTKKGDSRCLSSEGRFGHNINQLLLSYDPHSRQLGCVGDFKEYEKAQLEAQVIRLLRTNPGLTLKELREKLAVRSETLNAVLRDLIDRGKIRREQSGRSGDPFKHFLVDGNSGFQIDNTEIEETGN
ncbi:MAG: AAA family ATPase, partial [Candidatus Binataceae bacterium]